MEFWTYYRILKRRLRLIAVGLMVGIIIGGLTMWLGASRYAATVTLTAAAAQDSPVLVLISDRVDSRPDAATALAMDLLRSRTVTERVIQRLNLNRNPQQLRRRVRVTKSEGHLITLVVRDRDPTTAVMLANAFAEVAVLYGQEVNRREAALARQFVEQELEDTRVRLRRAEEALDLFKRRYGIISLEPQLTAEVGRITDLSLQQGSTALEEREVSARIAALRRALRQFTPLTTDQTLVENPVAQRLRAELVTLQVQMATAKDTYTEEHPTVITTKRRIKALEAAIAEEVEKVVTQEFVRVNPIHESLLQTLIELEIRRVALQARQAAVGSLLQREQRRLPTFSLIEREFAQLAREVQVAESAYVSLQSRLNDFRIREQAASTRNLVYIVDPATTAQRAASWPSRLVLAGMLGLAGALAIVLFQYQIDNTLKTAKDAERLLTLPVLSSIPRHNPPFEEAYRLLKTGLSLHVSNGRPQAIMFTSPKPGSGTSTVVFNLASTVARGGKRVIVVDADTRDSAAERLFGARSAHGLLDVLTDGVPAQEALVPSDIEHVRVLPALPASTPVAELADLFGSPRMVQLLDQLREMADVVLIDTPPVVSFAESRALAAVTDGVVVVVAAGGVPRGAEEEAKRQLERVHATLLGVVVNKISPEDDDNYYVHQHYRQADTPAKRHRPAWRMTVIGVILLGAVSVGTAIGVLLRYSAVLRGWLP